MYCDIFLGVDRNILMEIGVDISLFGDGKNLDLDNIQDKNLVLFVRTLVMVNSFLVVLHVNIMVEKYYA